MTHSKKLWLGAAIAAAAALTLAGCQATPDETGGEDADKVTVGFSVYDLQYEFFQTMLKGTEDAVEANGWDIIVHDEKSDENEMVTGAMDLLDQGVDVLIISPFKPDALGPVVAHAKELGIPVIINDIGGGGTPYDALVVSDNYDGGVQAADFIDQAIKDSGKPGKNVVSISCQPEAVYAAQRNVGFEAQIESLGYTVVTSLSGHSVAEEAYTIMKDALAKNPDIRAVFACTDPMANAAANAIRDSGLVPVDDIVVVGYNGDAEALTAIQNRTLSATVAQQPAGMGAKTVELAKTVLDGGTIAFDNAENREVFFPVNLITAENVAEFLK